MWFSSHPCRSGVANISVSRKAWKIDLQKLADLKDAAKETRTHLLLRGFPTVWFKDAKVPRLYVNNQLHMVGSGGQPPALTTSRIEV